jgi:hypothetical protein
MTFALSSTLVSAVTCTDSDGGKDYYVKGTTILWEDDNITSRFTFTDSCESNDALRENYCRIGEDGLPTTYLTGYLCPNGCTDGACNAPSIFKEQVKCVFDNSNEMQKCYTSDGNFGCSGVGTCVADVSGEKGKKITWKSSCEGYATTILDGENEYAQFTCASNPETPVLVKEQVKCIFDNSVDSQSCFAGDGKFICSGVGTCVADVSGEKGKKLYWLSTCEGDAYTVIDGDNEYAEFKCFPPIVETPVLVKEQVKCIFKNAKTDQKCYIAEDDPRFYCIGTDTCTVDVNGKKGEKLTWKSTCGGYAYTITDGDNEYVEFDCVPEGNTTIEAIGGIGFKYAYWKCYNGEEQNLGGESSCKFSETWQNHAEESCRDKCNKDGSKCGVSSFSVTEECYADYEKPEGGFLPSVNEGENSTLTDSLICKDSCPLDGKCYPFGYRKSNNFCSDTGSFVEQLEGDKVCENNFECSSNVCVSGTCVSEGLLQKILNWFKNLFS